MSGSLNRASVRARERKAPPTMVHAPHSTTHNTFDFASMSMPRHRVPASHTRRALFSRRLISSHLVSSHLISSHLISLFF